MREKQDIDLRKLSYEKLRMPMKDMEARNKEIKRRVKEECVNPPIGLICKFCGFEPCTMAEAAIHIMTNHPKNKKRGGKMFIKNQDKIIKVLCIIASILLYGCTIWLWSSALSATTLLKPSYTYFISAAIPLPLIVYNILTGKPMF